MNAVTVVCYFCHFLMNRACYDDFSFPWLWQEHGQPNGTQEADNEFGIGICYKFSQGLYFIIVYTALYLTILCCAILHYTTLCHTMHWHLSTWMHWICGWLAEGIESYLIPYYCNLNQSPSFQQFWSPSVTTHFSLTRIKANNFKSPLMTSQSLQHNPYWCCVKLSHNYGPAIGIRVAVQRLKQIA